MVWNINEEIIRCAVLNNPRGEIHGCILVIWCAIAFLGTVLSRICMLWPMILSTVIAKELNAVDIIFVGERKERIKLIAVLACCMMPFQCVIPPIWVPT